jgi:hypothetical protein
MEMEMGMEMEMEMGMVRVLGLRSALQWAGVGVAQR